MALVYYFEEYSSSMQSLFRILTFNETVIILQQRDNANMNTNNHDEMGRKMLRSRG